MNEAYLEICWQKLREFPVENHVLSLSNLENRLNNPLTSAGTLADKYKDNNRNSYVLNDRRVKQVYIFIVKKVKNTKIHRISRTLFLLASSPHLLRFIRQHYYRL